MNWKFYSTTCLLGLLGMTFWVLHPTISCVIDIESLAPEEVGEGDGDFQQWMYGRQETEGEEVDHKATLLNRIVGSTQFCHSQTPVWSQAIWKLKSIGGLFVGWLLFSYLYRVSWRRQFKRSREERK